jgi:hypothetical protein
MIALLATSIHTFLSVHWSPFQTSNAAHILLLSIASSDGKGIVQRTLHGHFRYLSPAPNGAHAGPVVSRNPRRPLNGGCFGGWLESMVR